jgi:lipid II:glycine glycyltransferase (peptidoglycan interpeptide bridge formation enzyme)
MTFWYVKDNVVYYHLGAYSDAGYRMRASFAAFWIALKHFVEIGIRWVSLGSAAGLKDRIDEGLSRFKRGWSTETRTAYFCGRIFQPQKYREIAKAARSGSSEYFPIYRKGEFR